MPQEVDEAWDGYRRLVLTKLDELTDSIKGVKAEIVDLRDSVTELKVKAAVWGAIFGAVGAAVVAAIASAVQGKTP